MKTNLDSIDTRFGSDSHYGFSRGNTLPYTGVPFGMNYFVPQTSDSQGSWFFNPNLPVYQGIRLTHQPSPWIGDYSWLLLTPVSELPSQPDLFHRQSSYLLDQAVFQPHYLKLQSTRYQIRTELTPTTYGAVLRLVQLEGKPISLFLHGQAGIELSQLDRHSLAGHIQQKTATTQKDLNFYFQLESEQAITSLEQVGQDWLLQFDSSQLEIKLASSYLSSQQAQLNLPKDDFEGTKKAAQTAWESLLHRFDVVDQGPADRRLFDHCLYRIFLFPQTFYELDERGQAQHINLQSGTICPGKLYTNIGFWDLYRTSFPLYSLILADRYPDFLEGFLNSYEDTGFLPKWLAPDERGMMPGTLIDGVLADACAKDLAPQLEEKILDAMLATASKEDPLGIHGRQGMAEYQQNGYLSKDHHESVSHSLDYAYSDFCIASLAQKLGKKDLVESYLDQSKNYRHLYNPERGYMEGRQADGSFATDFSPTSWGGDYAECSAIQASLSVPHDIEGLRQLMGGPQAWTDYLLKLCKTPAHFETTGYGYEIHEMTEMATAPFGQLAISNQPSFHIPYLFRSSLKPHYTSLIIKTLREQAFEASFQAYPGDEDNGSLSAWYIWSAMGLYPTCPGKPVYDLGIPLFNQLAVYLPERDHWLQIRCHDNHSHHYFVSACSADGKAISQISHQDLLTTQNLDFSLSWLP